MLEPNAGWRCTKTPPTRGFTRRNSDVHAARQQPAVDDEELAGDEAGRVGGQVHAGAHQLLDAPEAAHGRAHQELLAAPPFQDLAIQIRFEHAGRDRVHGQAVRRPLDRQRAREAGDAGFARRVRRDFQQSNHRRDRGDADQPPEPLRDHRRRECLVGAHHARQIGFDDLIPLPLAHLDRRRAFRDARRRHDDVDSAERLQARVAKSAQRRRIADVSRHPQRPASLRLDRRRDFIDNGRAASGRDDVGAGVGQAQRQGAPDARGAADDDGRASGQIE